MATKTSKIKEKTIITNIIKEKSPNDSSIYKHLILDNNLEVIIVHDAEIDVAGVSLTVNIGSYDNPKDYLGLAHFLEHMLFMGSKKYPEVNYFHEFINKNGGSRNAHTADEYTSYYYNIFNDKLLESLDIFLQFFVEPSFNKTTISKELEAVDSEHAKNITVDEIRTERIANIISNNNYPSFNFSTGNLETLQKPNIRTELIKFYYENYSADLMKLCVISNLDLEILKKQIITLFSKIKNLNKKKNNLNLNFKLNILDHKLINIIPIKHEHIIHIYWQFPSLTKYIMSKPLSYIINILGNESHNSIYYSLKQKYLCNDLSCYICSFDKNLSLLCLKINLTKLGLNNINLILNTIFSYINILTSNQELYEEYAKIADLEFKHLQKDNSINRALAITENLIYYPVSRILDLHYNYEKYNNEIKTVINEYISYLNYNKCLIMISSPKFEVKHLNNLLTEKYYDIKYTINALKYNINNNAFKFKLIELNKYLPTQEDLIVENATFSYKKINLNISKNKELYYIQSSSSFNNPKVIILIYLYNNLLSKNLNNSLYLFIYNQIFNYIINPILYTLGEAGSNFSVSITDNYLSFNLTTYRSKIKYILNKLFFIYINLKDYITQDIFDYIKKKYLQVFKNYIFKPPYQLALIYLKDSILTNYYDFKEWSIHLEKLKLNDIKNCFNELLLNKNKLVCVIAGNIKDIKIKDIKIKDIKIKDIKINLELLDIFVLLQEKEKEKVFILENNIRLKLTKKINNFDIKLYNKQETNSVILVHYNLDILTKTKEIKKIMMLKLIESIIEDNFFNQLRSIEQSGYIVNSSMFSSGIFNYKIYGLNFVIQTYKANLDKLEKSILRFVNKSKLSIKQDNLDKHKETLINLLNKKNENIYDEFSIVLDEIVDQTYIFDIKEKYLDVIKTISLKDMVDFYDYYFLNKHSLTRCVVKMLAQK